MSVSDKIQKAKTEVAIATPAAQLKLALDKHRGQLARSLPAHMNIDRFISVVNGAVSVNPAIAECDPISIMQSVGQAARMGLEINISGHGFLVPYNDKRRGKICQFIPGWQGIVDLINRSGRGVVKNGAVFDGDFFDYDLGLNAYLKHRNDGAEDPAKLMYVYAIGHIKGDSGWTPPPLIEVWKIEKVKMHFDEYNRVGAGHYANANGNNWIQYAKKLPLLQVCKFMPKSAEISRAIEAANKADSGEPFTIDGDFNFAADDGAASPPAASAPPPAGPTYAQLAEKIKAAKTRDVAELVLDEGRALPADQLKDLAALADGKFPRS
jgi:recombination protein RecT